VVGSADMQIQLFSPFGTRGFLFLFFDYLLEVYLKSVTFFDLTSLCSYSHHTSSIALHWPCHLHFSDRQSFTCVCTSFVHSYSWCGSCPCDGLIFLFLIFFIIIFNAGFPPLTNFIFSSRRQSTVFYWGQRIRFLFDALDWQFKLDKVDPGYNVLYSHSGYSRFFFLVFVGEFFLKGHHQFFFSALQGSRFFSVIY